MTRSKFVASSIFFIILVVVFLLVAEEPKMGLNQLHQSEAIVENEGVNATENQGGALAQGGSKLDYHPAPFPLDVPQQELCAEVNEKQRSNWKKYTNEVKKQADIKYFEGHSKESVANALWQIEGWPSAQSWYKKADLLDTVKRHIDLLRNEPDAKNLVDEYNKLFATNAELANVMYLSESVEKLWHSIPVNTIERMLEDGAEAESIVAEVESALSAFPTFLLKERHLSPLPGLIYSMINNGRLDVAAVLLNHYPGLIVGSSKYENGFRSEILRLVGNQLNTNQLPDSLDKLIEGLKLNEEPLHLFSIDMAMFGNQQLFNTLEKLESFSVSVPYVLLNDAEPPVSELTFDATLATLNESDKQTLEKCEEVEDWLDSRSKTLSEWKAFNNSAFVSSVTHSFERQYCENQESNLYGDEFWSSIKASVTNLRKYVSENKLSISEMDLSDLPTEHLPADIKSVIGAILTKELMDEKTLSQLDIRSRISKAGLAPSNAKTDLLMLLFNMEHFDIWTKDLNLGNRADSYKLLNMAALEGNFEQFSQLNSVITKEDNLMHDPFYFFVAGYSPLRFTGTNNFSFNEQANKQFVDHFLQSGYEVNPHHLRAALRMKLNNNKSYDELIGHFPQLAHGNPQQYFDVTCDQ